MSIPDLLTLSDDDLAGLGIETSEIADCIEDAIRKTANGTLWTAPKVAVQPGDGRYMMATLASSDNPGVMVVKSVLLNPENPSRGLDTINGAIMVFDSNTGLLRCVMSANWITAVRTAGLSTVAARKLANPESSTIAFVGTGVQARSHLDAFRTLFPLTSVHISGRGQTNIDRLCAIAHDYGMSAKICATPQEALDGADIVVTSITATFSGDPFLDAHWLKPGAFAAITDLGKPWIQDKMDGFSTIVIDDHSQEKAAPIPMVPPDLVTADLTELASGKIRLAFDPNKRSAFAFRGLAVGDFAVAAVAYDRAQKG